MAYPTKRNAQDTRSIAYGNSCNEDTLSTQRYQDNTHQAFFFSKILLIRSSMMAWAR